MQIGEKIEKLRKEKNLTQTELAKALMLKQDTISRIEKGRREISNSELVAISKFFGVSTDYLLGVTPERTTDTDIRAICEYTGLSEKAVHELNINLRALRSIENKESDIIARLLNLSFDIINQFIEENFYYVGGQSLVVAIEGFFRHVEKAQEICNQAQNIDDFENLTNAFNEYISETDLAGFKKYQIVDSFKEHFISRFISEYDGILEETENKMKIKFDNMTIKQGEMILKSGENNEQG